MRRNAELGEHAEEAFAASGAHVDGLLSCRRDAPRVLTARDVLKVTDAEDQAVGAGYHEHVAR